MPAKTITDDGRRYKMDLHGRVHLWWCDECGYGGTPMTESGANYAARQHNQVKHPPHGQAG